MTDTPAPAGGSRLGFWALALAICLEFGACCLGFPTADASSLAATRPMPAARSVLARSTSDDVDQFVEAPEHRANPIDEINAALRRYGRLFLWVGVGLSGVIALRIINPIQIYYGAQDRRLRRALRPVDELLKRIQKEAEVNNEAPTRQEEEAAAEAGLLAGMAEIAEFELAEEVPAYVLTVNDLMLDNIAATMKKLRRFHDGSAEKYKNNLFAVVQGIKTISEQSEEAGVPSGLAVNVKAYFADERRYKIWRKMLHHWARRGKHQETASAFLVFMKAVREGRPLAAPKPSAVSLGDTAVTAAVNEPDVPDVLTEETLPLLQKAAAEEARSFCAFIEEETPAKKTAGWQFELVQRQLQIRTRDEAQRMLNVFLICERKALQEITKIKMLPCRTWGHVLHMLGAEDTAKLRKRVEDRLLTTQEILILEKAFLQTFAKRVSLLRVYGHGHVSASQHNVPRSETDAGLMIDMHVPEIRREAMALLQQLRQTEPDRLNTATETLNEEETPHNEQVKRLIAHYVK